MTPQPIQLKDLHLSYEDLCVAENLNLSFTESRITCLLGKNGCGKSTLLKAISGLHPFQGTISLAGKKASYVCQNPEEMLLPWLTNEENIIFPLRKKDLNGEDFAFLEELLQLTGLEAWRKKYPYQLSGGMAQALLLARALLQKSEVLLLDEPFKSLDFSRARTMQALLKRLHLKYLPTIILVSHSLEEAHALADEIILFSERPLRVLKNWSQKQEESKKSFTQFREEVCHALCI